MKRPPAPLSLSLALSLGLSKALSLALFLGLCLAAGAAAMAQSRPGAPDAFVHEHGLARMTIVVERTSLELRLRTPLDSVLGFESSPRTGKQRRAVKDLALRLHQPERLLVPSASAGCSPSQVLLSSAVIEPALLTDAPDPPAVSATVSTTPAARKPAAGVHADLDATIIFECRQPQLLTGMQVKLFEAFPNLLQIDARIVTPRGESGARLSPNRPTLTW